MPVTIVEVRAMELEIGDTLIAFETETDIWKDIEFPMTVGFIERGRVTDGNGGFIVYQTRTGLLRVERINSGVHVRNSVLCSCGRSVSGIMIAIGARHVH